jgi:hypothetical protein
MKFKLGYYYKFIGNKNNYTWFKDKKKILDNKWNKCVAVIENFNGFARFEGMENEWLWDYGDFIESKYPPEWKIRRLLNEI